MIHIYFDGGSRNNQFPDREGYGSFKTFNGEELVKMTIDRGTKDEIVTEQCHINFGNATNNEAEWKTFLREQIERSSSGGWIQN